MIVDILPEHALIYFIIFLLIKPIEQLKPELRASIFVPEGRVAEQGVSKHHRQHQDDDLSCREI